MMYWYRIIHPELILFTQMDKQKKFSQDVRLIVAENEAELNIRELLSRYATFFD